MKPIHDIAVIGIACQLPEADNPSTFFENLTNGRCSIRPFSSSELETSHIPAEIIQHPNYKAFGAPLEDISRFDHEYFQLTPKEAKLLDPQHRLLMELSLHTLEDAGINDTHDLSIGIFGSVSASSYFLNNLLPAAQQHARDFTVDDAYRGTRNSFAISRIAYHLGFTGPAMLIDTACSSSLVAVHEAIQAIKNNECDVALAGGVSIQVPIKSGYLHHQDSIMSADGLCKAFDATASGSVRGNGGGLVMLKALDHAIEDKDKIYGIVAGSAVNNDGSQRIGFTAPSINGQSLSLSQALKDARIDGDQLLYLEAHGSGTVLGDEIELKAIDKVLRTDFAKQQANPGLKIGSVKTNIGHLDGAAGIAGFIKTLLMLDRRTLVPSLHYTHPNNTLKQLASLIQVQTETECLSEEETYHMAVASLGIGGTNAHIIVRSYCNQNDRHLTANPTLCWIPLTAINAVSLKNQVRTFAKALANLNNSQLPSVMKTLFDHRKHHRYRVLFSGQDIASLSISVHQFLENFATSFKENGTYVGQATPPVVLQQWLSGDTLNFARIYPDFPNTPWIRLPNYQFQKHYHWVSPPGEALKYANPVTTEAFEAKPASQGNTATTLIQLWEKAFGFSPIQTDKNFFELGGHSLLAIQILSQINEQFNSVLGLKDFFSNPTINEQITLLEASASTDLESVNQWNNAPGQARNYREVPLTPMQLELWYQHMLAPDGQTYNLVAAEQIIGPLQLDLLYEAIAGCVQKHSILRARYKFAKNQVIQTTTDTIHQVIHYQDISHSDNSIEYHIDSFGNGPFDLTVGQLFEACILRESQDRHSLILRQHRIVSDAQTLGILFREIVNQYSRLVESTQAPNVGMDNDGGNDNGYYDFSYQLQINLNDKELLSPASQRLLQEKLFWQERLHNAPVTQIPTAGKHHTTLSDKGCSQRFTLPSGFTPQITSLCETHGLSVFSLLLGTFKLALHSFTKQTDIIVVTPALNRHQAEFAHTVGHFMNRVAIRSHLDIQNSLIATLTKIHQNNLQALEHQSLPFEAMLEATGLLGRYRHEPLFQTVFMMQDTEQDESLSLPNIRLNPLKVPFHRSRYDLTGVMRLEQGVLHGRIDCKSELLNSLTLERFIQVWIELIETVVRYPNQQMSSAINYQLIHTLETDTTLLTENPGSAHKSQNNQNCDTAINYWRQALGTYLPNAQCNVTPSPDFWQLGGTTQQLVLLFNLIKKDFPTAYFKEIAKQTQISSHQAYLTSLGSVTPTTHEIDEHRKRYPTGDRHQLSPFQQRLWFLQKYHPTSQAYNLPAAFLIEGEISPKKLYNALCNTKKQFYLLNCGIIESDHTPYWSDSDAPIHWQVNDLSDMHPQDQDASLEYIADNTLKSTFDIGGKNQTPPLLWRCTWVQLSQTESVLFLCFHHLIADQVSGGLFLQSLLDHYHGLTHSQPDNLLQPETDHCNFKDFINFQYSWLKSTEAHDQRRFWQTYLAPCRDLDLEFTSTAQEFKTQELTLNLTTRQTASLVQLSKQTAVTLSTLLQTLYGIFLYRITGNTTFCIGMPISLHDNQWRNCFGPLLNTLPVKFETKPFLGLAQQVQLFSESLLQAIAHKDLPLEEILSTTSTTRTSDLPPLFQTLYSYLEEQPLSLATSALKLTTIPTSSETSDYPIALEVVKQSNALEMRLSLSESHFNQETRQQLTDTFTRLIEQCITDNTTPIQNYLIPDRSSIEAKPYSSLSAEFLSQTQSIPERTAIVSEYRTLSYSTLGLLAGNIQQQLAKHGVSHGQGIAILIEHREMLPSLLLACLASGIYFVPIDKRWEKERIHQVVVDSQVSALLMDSGFSSLDSLSIPVIQLADLKLPLYPDHAETQYFNAYQLIDRSKPSDLAYIMYTSGSTGKPKGVTISQRALSSYSQNIPSDIKPKAQHNVLALTSLSFDIMITELLIPLLAGGTVAVFNDSLMPNALAQFIKQHQVNYIQTTPSLWQLLLEAKDLEFAADTIALAGGETLPKSLATQLLDKGVTLYNVYGPTEATVWCSSKKVTRTLIARSQDYIRNIGTPFNNTQAMVCNQQLTELGEGAIGEMLLSGENLADGYWRNQALSETLFINHCTTDDSLRAAKTKVYRTGDRVQIINGEIYFLGRNDDQIKLNGQRIELNEINRAINKIDGVQVVYSTLLNRGNVPCLASYVCAVNLAPQTIKQHLIGKLPSHYVPSLIVVDPDTELSSNGKWHVAKMKVRLSQELLGSRQQDTHDRLSKDVANSAVMEVINAMAAVLDCKNIAPGDNFFDIGGNSLLAMRVINRLSESMNLKLTVRSIFESPTPIQLGHLISSFTAQDNANNNEELYEEGEI